MERLSRLVDICDFYSLLVFHMGNSDTKGKLVIINRDFRALKGQTSVDVCQGSGCIGGFLLNIASQGKW